MLPPRWAAMEGETCAYLYMQRGQPPSAFDEQPREVVQLWFGPMEIPKDETSTNYDECVELASGG